MDATAELNRENLPATNHDVAIADLEAWLTEWMNRATPILIGAYHAFMGMVKGKANADHDLDAEANCFYELLAVTRELTSCKPYVEKAASVLAPSMVKDDYIFTVERIDDFLSDVESRCIDIDGEKYISKEDLISFLKTTVKLISDVAAEFARLIERAVEPFNEFVKNFDENLQIDLVDGEYYLAADQELQETLDQLDVLNKKLHLNDALKLSCVRDLAQEVYVVTSNEDLVDYIKRRWGDEILLTKHAIDSINESPFKDLKKLISVFDVLGRDFYQCFMYGQRMEQAINALSLINVEFKPQISDKAKGRHNIYNRPYKNRFANFDRHLCVGTSRDAALCYRVHFEYCDEEEKIVIHHAGKHLPMSDD